MPRKAIPIDDRIRRMTVPFEVKAAQSADGQFAGEIEGYAAGIHNVDRAGDMILPGAFVEDLPRFLSEGVICWQHDWMTPIGKPMEAREDAYGLFSKARISKTQTGLDCMTLIKDGVVNKLSIGYRVQDYQWVDRAGLVAYLAGSGLSAEKQASILRQYDEADLDELFLLKKLKLYEYSPVTIPANPNASITGAKGLPFADHSQAVITAVRELSERVKSIHALRAEQGNRANPQHVELCKSLLADFDSLSTELRAQVAEMGASASNGNAQAIFNRYLRFESRLLDAA